MRALVNRGYLAASRALKLVVVSLCAGVAFTFALWAGLCQASIRLPAHRRGEQQAVKQYGDSSKPVRAWAGEGRAAAAGEGVGRVAAAGGVWRACPLLVHL